ncbi:MAG TPA: hypothetical protein DEP57_06140 [Selenomonas sp.]|nr:hypothetical protein [Selenomonadaceae bacterium]HCB93374.1 hypothetical protein [Selenomonas sp.]
MFHETARKKIEYDNPRVEKMRSPQEVLARYNLSLRDYKALNESKVDNREQRLMIYTEIKLLGWMLGKPEKNVLKDLNACK